MTAERTMDPTASQSQEVDRDEGARTDRRIFYKKTPEQLAFLQQWWESQVKAGGVKATMIAAGQRKTLAGEVAMPVEVLENWLGNKRSKCRKKDAARKMKIVGAVGC
jgi:hypothetical protein